MIIPVYKHKKELFSFLAMLVLTAAVIYVTRTASNSPGIVINEICSSNFSVLQNSSGEYADYIELYNASDFQISLLDWTLHTENELSKFYTFGDIILEPQAHLLLVHNADAAAGGDSSITVTSGKEEYLEIPCAVSKAGETVYLRNSSHKTADSVDVPALDYDTVYARSTDGNSSWGIYTPTPGMDNALADIALPVDMDTSEPVFAADELSLPLEEYSDFPILSLSVSEDDLYGTEGIFLPENLGLSGRDAERKCQIDYFSAGLHYEFSQIAGIRVGSRSDNLEHLDFNLYARWIYDDKTTFSYDFFGKGYSYDKLLLDYDASKEYLLHQFLEKKHLSSASSIPCVLFLNGRFYGEYYLTEPLDEAYIANTYQLKMDDIILLEDGQLAYGSEYSLLEYRQVLQDAMESGLSDKTAYDNLCNYIDMDSLIDCYAVQIFLNDHKFSPYHNCILWKSESIDDSNPYADGKWHYEITGLSDTLSDPSTDNGIGTNTFFYIMEQDSFFSALSGNDTFRQLLSARITALAKQDFSASEAESLLSDSHYFYESSKDTREEFRLFFQGRPSYLLFYLEELMNETNE